MSEYMVQVDIGGDCPFCHTPKMSHNFYLGGRAPSIVCDKAQKPQGVLPSFIPMAHESPTLREKVWMWNTLGGPNRGPMPDDFMADENKPTVIANDRGRFEVNGYELPVLFDTTRREGTRIPLSPLSNTPIANVSIPGYQKMWLCSNHLTPVPDIPKGEKCSVCGAMEAN
jgi:hypothetical protein